MNWKVVAAARPLPLEIPGPWPATFGQAKEQYPVARPGSHIRQEMLGDSVVM